MRGAKGMHSVEAAVQQQHGGEGREGGEGGEEGPSVGGEMPEVRLLAAGGEKSG